MPKRIAVFCCVVIFLSAGVCAQPAGGAGNGSGAGDRQSSGAADRVYWLKELDRLARPVLSNLAHDELKKNMPVVLSKRTDNAADRLRSSYLEAFGRLLSGIAPWLNGEGGTREEVALRDQYRAWVIPAISHAVDPAAKDHMLWNDPAQALVDASYFALGFLRCPWLWDHLSETTRAQVVSALQSSRAIKPGFNNWLLFSGMIEAFFCRYGQPWDEMRVDYCVRQLDQWYKGDGIYSDGPSYHWDYYNSYVIHPYLAQILETVNGKSAGAGGGGFGPLTEKMRVRDERYAIIQERLINADGSYPATGRSIVYRGGAFHHLADMSWHKRLPAVLHPAQIRSALTAVIRRTMDAPGTYTAAGWLTIGIVGSQPDLADVYNTTGSLYLCSNILLPLGLPATDEFWSAPPEKWTAQKIWSGEDTPGDHSID